MLKPLDKFKVLEIFYIQVKYKMASESSAL